MPKKRLAIITSHPIQYNAPVFTLLQQRQVIEIKVFYTWGKEAMGSKYDPGFKKEVAWDLPLLDGYEHEFLTNISKQPGSHHFKGIINPDVLERINNYKPDAILVYGWSFHSHLKVMRAYKGKKRILFRGDSTLLDQGRGVKAIMRQVVLKWVYRNIDIALYTGRNNYAYYKQFGLKDKNLVWAPHTVDNNRFSGSNEENLAASRNYRMQLNIPAHALVFLFSGKLENKKDPMLLLQAFLDTDLHQTCHLVFAGSGELEEALKQKAAASPNIHFIGFQNQQIMPVIYRIGDVYVLPSKGPGETWGLAINEAMACGRPVIVSDKCGGAPDLVEEGKNGYTFHAGNLQDLKIKMLEIYHQKERLPEMGDHSSKVISSFTIERVCSTIEQMVA